MKEPKALFIRYKKTKGVLDGGEIASQKHYEALCDILDEENVTTLYIHDENKVKSPLDYIMGVVLFFFNYYFGLTPSRVNEIVEKAQGYDIVFIDRSVFGIIAKRLKENGYKGKVISFYHNVETMYFNAKLGKKPWKNIILRCVDKNDKYAAEYSDATITLNKRDRVFLKKMYGLKNNHIIPITFEDRLNPFDSQSTEITSQEPTCLFLGSYFPANVEGILWFINNVFTKVNIKLLIAGKGMDAIIPQINNITPAKRQNIEVRSDVPDLTPLFLETDAVILPIFSGSGMKVKTCESLMFGRNIYGTKEAFEGYDIDFQKIGGKCDTANDFIRALQDLANNPRPKFNKASREAYLSKYTDEAVRPVWKEILKGEE